MPAAPSSPRRVLVVEDQEDCLATTVELISMHGYEVRAASDGEAAIAVAQAFQPHVVLLDLGLPKLDGYAVAKALRADPRTQGATLVAITGYGLPAHRERSAAAGIDLHLVKPVPPDELLKQLQRLVPAGTGPG